MQSGDIVELVLVQRPDSRLMYDRTSRDSRIDLTGSWASYPLVQACRYPSLLGAKINRPFEGNNAS